MAAQENIIELKTVKGVGEKTEEKLREKGIGSARELAACLPDEVVEAVGGDDDSAALLIYNARTILTENGLILNDFVSAKQILDARNRVQYCTTGSKALDDLLGGGIETQAVTELFGAYGSGKSQLCHTLAALCQLPAERGGLDGGAIYIDTEGTFRAGRLQEIAESRGLDSGKILENVLCCRTYNAPHLEMVCRSLGSHIEKNNTKVVVVDSVISLYRSEFIGRETLADRQQRLSVLIHKLHSLAEVYGIAVVITNQVVSTPNTFFGDPNKPTGGNVLGHGSTYRIQLRRSGEERIATIVDSPCHAYSETRFTITKGGVADTETKKAKGE